MKMSADLYGQFLLSSQGNYPGTHWAGHGRGFEAETVPRTGVHLPDGRPRHQRVDTRRHGRRRSRTWRLRDGCVISPCSRATPRPRSLAVPAGPQAGATVAGLDPAQIVGLQQPSDSLSTKERPACRVQATGIGLTNTHFCVSPITNLNPQTPIRNL